MDFKISIKFIGDDKSNIDIFANAKYILDEHGNAEEIKLGRPYIINKIYGFANDKDTIYINNKLIKLLLIEK